MTGRVRIGQACLGVMGVVWHVVAGWELMMHVVMAWGSRSESLLCIELHW